MFEIAPVTAKALLPIGDDRYDYEKRRKAAKAVLDATLGEAGIVYSLHGTKDTWDTRVDSCVAEMQVSVPADMKETVVELMEGRDGSRDGPVRNGNATRSSGSLSRSRRSSAFASRPPRSASDYLMPGCGASSSARIVSHSRRSMFMP